MKNFIRDNWKFLLFVLLGGLIGGFFTGYYVYDTLSEEMLRQIQEQHITKELYAIVSMIQYGFQYGLILAIIGIILSKKVNLWNSFKFSKKAIITTAIITIIGALVLFPLDKIIFGPLNSWVGEQYNYHPTISKIISGLLAGGIIEEVIMRLFLMSLIVFIESKLIFKNKKEIPVKAYVMANIIVALLFGLLHLPSTMIFTTLTPILVIRSLILNGCFSLCFGYLYRKYNIGYAIISHGLSHLIADILMIIFI